MFPLRTALATLVLVLGLGSTGHAQMMNFGGGAGFGHTGFYGGFGGFQPGFGGQQFGVVPGVSLMGPAISYPYGYGYGYDPTSYPAYGYYPPPAVMYNSIDSLMGSIQTSTSRRGGWRGGP